MFSSSTSFLIAFNNAVGFSLRAIADRFNIDQIRHSQNEQSGTVYPEENGFARVKFDAPQRAVTPGQAVVLYQGDMVVGGGTITEAL